MPLVQLFHRLWLSRFIFLIYEKMEKITCLLIVNCGKPNQVSNLPLNVWWTNKMAQDERVSFDCCHKNLIFPGRNIISHEYFCHCHLLLNCFNKAIEPYSFRSISYKV